jgi:DNA repair protein RecO (recombination protein O)
MIESTAGLVIRTRPLTESSLIVHWLTDESGRVATVAKGARKPKSAFQGKIDLFYQCNFSYARSKKSELHTLSEVKLLGAHGFLRKNLAAFQQACYCAALIEATSEIDTPLPGSLPLMLGFLKSLESGLTSPQSVFAFELKWLAALGFATDLERESLSPGSREVVRRLNERDWMTPTNLVLSDSQNKEISRFLLNFMRFHLERVPAGRNEALELAP